MSKTNQIHHEFSSFFLKLNIYFVSTPYHKVFLYLDDRLTINKMPKAGVAPKAAWTMCAVQIALGGFINRAKSTFTCQREIEFLGFILTDNLSPPPPKKEEI